MMPRAASRVLTEEMLRARLGSGSLPHGLMASSLSQGIQCTVGEPGTSPGWAGGLQHQWGQTKWGFGGRGTASSLRSLRPSLEQLQPGPWGTCFAMWLEAVELPSAEVGPRQVLLGLCPAPAASLQSTPAVLRVGGDGAAEGREEPLGAAWYSGIDSVVVRAGHSAPLSLSLLPGCREDSTDCLPGALVAWQERGSVRPVLSRVSGAFSASWGLLAPVGWPLFSRLPALG